MADAPQPPARYDDLTAVFVNCTLKQSPRTSHNRGPRTHLDRHHARRRRHRRRDPSGRPRHRPGRLPRHDRARRDQRRLATACGSASSAPTCSCCSRRSGSARSRRCAPGSSSASTPSPASSTRAGQYAFYGRVGGVLVTGNEDGIKHCRHERAVLAAAPRLHDPAAGGRRLDRRSGAGPELPRHRGGAVWTTTSPTATRPS